MKKGSNILKISVLVIMLLFMGIKGVNADTKTITYSVSDPSGAFVNKKLGDEVAYCLSGASKTAPPVGVEYTSNNEVAANVKYAYIIQAERNNGMAYIEGALYENGASTTLPQAYNDDLALFNSSGTISASPNKLDFQKNGTNYKATVTLSGRNFTSYGTCTISGATGNISTGTITNNSGTITITIPQSSIVNDTKVTLTCSNAVQKYSTTKTYVCSKTNNEYSCSDYQVLVVERQGEKKSSINLSGTIKAEKKGSIIITKKGKNSQGKTVPLKGVKFVIKNSKGKSINESGVEEEGYEFTTNANGIIQVTNMKISQTASENVYTIEEISTISGYKKSNEKITVTISESNNEIRKEIINETVKVTISKTDATGKKELPGAKLSILDKDGKVLNKCVFDKDKHLITYSDGDDATACTWASTDKSYIFEGLPVGKYYLVEELAPEGYQKSTEKILIEIKENGAVKDKIEMKNALEVPVPDTLSARSALLLAVAMFDIALGIGILLYVKKSKNQE